MSRQGNTLHAPEWFLAGLPDLPVGRRAVAGTQGVSEDRQHRAPPGLSGNLARHQFRIFDAPATSGPFEDRIEHLRRRVLAACACVRQRPAPDALPGHRAFAGGTRPDRGSRRRRADAAATRITRMRPGVPRRSSRPNAFTTQKRGSSATSRGAAGTRAAWEPCLSCCRTGPNSPSGPASATPSASTASDRQHHYVPIPGAIGSRSASISIVRAGAFRLRAVADLTELSDALVANYFTARKNGASP